MSILALSAAAATPVLTPRTVNMADMGTFDILGSDPYPIGSGNETTSGVHGEVNLTVFQTDNARPVWEVIQAMNW